MSKYIPISCYIELTSQCNLKCIHCYNDSGIHKKNQISLEKFKNIIVSLQKYETRNIILSGGEIFTLKNIKEYFDAIPRDFGIEIITNGTIVNQEIINLIKDRKATLQISIEGASDLVNDLIRGKGSFNLLEKNIDLFKENGVNYYFKTTINKNNYLYLEEIIKYAIEKKAKKFFFGFVKKLGRAINNHLNLELEPKIKKDIIKNLILYKQKYKELIDIDITTISETYCPIVYGGEKLNIIPKVNYEGYIYLCQIFDNKKYSCGNIYDITLDEALSYERTETIRRYILQCNKKLDKCNKCFARKYCNNGCPENIINNEQIETDDLCPVRKEIILETIIGKLYD